MVNCNVLGLIIILRQRGRLLKLDSMEDSAIGGSGAPRYCFRAVPRTPFCEVVQDQLLMT